MDTCSSAENFTRQNIFGKGEENTAYAAYFTGQSYLNPLTGPAGRTAHGQCDL